MKKITDIIKALCIISLLGTPLSLAAQDDDQSLNRELTLEREYNPSVQDANKVNTLPAVREPDVTRMPIDYAILSIPAEPGREIGTLAAERLLSDMTYNNRRGYLNLGVGTYRNINGDAGYHILSTDKDRLNLFLSHRSSNGDVKYQESYLKGEKVRAKLNNNLGGLNYRHEFSRAALRLGAMYGYSAFNYYGIPAPSMYSVWPSPVVDTETNQQSRQITLNAGLESKKTEPVGYVLDVDYTGFAYKYAWDNSMDGITEHSTGARMNLYKMFGADRWIGLAARMNSFFYNLPEASSATFANYMEGTLTPYYQVEGDFWNLKLGMNLMFVTPRNDEKMKVFITPNAGFDLKAGSGTLLYLNAGGDIRSNSAFLLSRENLYTDPYMGVTPSRTWLDAVAGIKTAALPGFWFHAFAEYKRTDDDYFFIPYLMPEGFGNVSRVLSYDSKLLRVGVEVKYAYRKLVEINLKGVYNNWNEEKEILRDEQIQTPDFQLIPERKAYGRPQRELMADIHVRPIGKVALTLNYRLSAGRKTLLYNKNEEMKDISELNFTGAYIFNDTWGAYLKLNNLLFKKYELIYGYPLQGFNLMAGININF
ncbi:MAG: TonB-dependent receptor [Tannerellaceae bacterium]|nr:TonB-dependent receptor [Tannerellaceae bacterium]